MDGMRGESFPGENVNLGDLAIMDRLSGDGSIPRKISILREGRPPLFRILLDSKRICRLMLDTKVRNFQTRLRSC